MQTGSTFIQNGPQSIGQTGLGQTIGQLPSGRYPFTFRLFLVTARSRTGTTLERSDGHGHPFVVWYRTVLLEMVKQRFAIRV